MSETAKSFHKLCGPLHISAFSALMGYFDAEIAEIRRDDAEFCGLKTFSCYYLVLSAVGGAPETFSYLLLCVARFEHARSNKLNQHFSRLLTFLCADDPDEAGRRYLRLHEKLESYFRTRGVADTSAAADETLDRAGRRLAEGADVPNINSFCLGIARFIIMESWRINTRESAAFLQFLEQHEQATDDQIHRLSLMKQCFEQLPHNERDLLDSYCKALRGQARAQHRRDLAESLSTNVAALRIRVTRLRKDLEDCVKNLTKDYW